MDREFSGMCVREETNAQPPPLSLPSRTLLTFSPPPPPLGCQLFQLYNRTPGFLTCCNSSISRSFVLSSAQTAALIPKESNKCSSSAADPPSGSMQLANMPRIRNALSSSSGP